MCQCKANHGYISIFVGCKWKLVDDNCPSVLFSQALDSANFDDSFDNRTFTEDSLEVVDTTHETDSVSLTLLKDQLDDLKQQLEQVKEQFNSDPIQVITGTLT